MSLNLDKSAWKRVAFGDVAMNVNDYFNPARDGVLPYVAGPHITASEATVRDYGSTDDDDFPPTFKRKFRSGDVLLHSRGIEKLASVDRPGVTGEKLFVLRSRDENVLLQRLLVWLLQGSGAQAHMRDNFTGSVNKFLNWRPLAAMQLALPPLDEQKRIADLLWAAESHRIALDHLRNAVDGAVCTRLTQFWLEGRHKRSIGSIAEGVTGSTPSKAMTAYWETDDVPFYTPSEIGGDAVGTPSQWVSHAGAAKGRMLPKDSVAVVCIGGDMGRSAVITEPGISNQQITSIVGLSTDDAFALQSLLAHPLGRLAMEARETTTIVRKLNKGDLLKVQVPWPNDRALLHEVVREARAVHRALESEHASLGALRSTLLTDIFGSG